MKYIKLFEDKYADNVKLIEDYFLDISDTHNFRRVKRPGDQDFIYMSRIYIPTNSEGILRSLNVVNLRASNLKGCFAILNNSSQIEEKYILTLKYLRGILKHPDFSDDIGIFRNRLIDAGFKVVISRGSSVPKVVKNDDEIYFQIIISKLEA